MATLFKDVKYNLNTLIQNIDLETIALPEKQRPLDCRYTKVSVLFDNLYNGYQVGYLLIWETVSNREVRRIDIDNKQKYANLLNVDGQQRLTSVYSDIK